MAADYRFMWVDAFTDRSMAGNPCVVVFDADGVPVGTRIALVRETGLSECAFLQRSDKADFGARYYLATREILMAGHPTIATCRALEAAGLLEGRDRITLEVGTGVIPVDIRRGAGATVFTMTQFAPKFGREYAPDVIAALYGLEPGDIVGTPQTVSTGSAFCITVLKDHDALRRAQIDPAAFAAHQPDTDFFEPFLCVIQGFTAAGDTSARLLLAPPMPAEDPFTGAATGCMAAYLWANGLIGGPRFVAEQGHWMGRPGRGDVEVLGPRDAISGVRLGGAGAVLMQGTVRL
jgi:PhzF family phenazine biosynthesis protein